MEAERTKREKVIEDAWTNREVLCKSCNQSLSDCDKNGCNQRLEPGWRVRLVYDLLTTPKTVKLQRQILDTIRRSRMPCTD